MKAIIGKKVGMSQIFDENGKVIPVTVIEAGPCVVVQKKTAEKEGYAAVQLGDASSTMNLRQAPTTQSQVVAQLKSGRRLIVCSEADDGGWVRVRTAEYEGYCKLEYLKAE